ncbi:MAG TPA: DNA primase [Ktedonobacteraceae bacterium]|jgi:DNA primase|nr:DNA primase [Ktedonobacteraceae bacterium]
MASLIEEIKAKVDVVDEVGLVVALQKSGKSLKGLCPFHNERTPSFYVFPESQTWHCFGCNEGGDVFSFVEKQQGLEFRDALLYLAEKAGIPVEGYEGDRDPEQERETHAAKERLRKLNEDAQLWFHQVLLRSREAAEARAYIRKRGISPESVIAFGLGYAPDRWDGLCKYLLGLGYSERELVNGGLARARGNTSVWEPMGGRNERAGETENESGQSESGESRGVYDYFRNRIIFPIRDIRGRVIGFGGRALGDESPKYLNSPQTMLFEKNTVLYALDMAREAIKLEKQVIIVEGYVDAVVAHQYGTKQTVACIGSAITEKHIQQLKKLTKQVTLALDPDAAGAAATEHGIQEAMKGFDRKVVPVPLADEGSGVPVSRWRRRAEPQGMIRLEEQVDAEINVLQLPAGEDPDEVIQRDFAAWSYAVAHPLPLVDYYFVVRTADLNLREPVGKSEAAKRLLPVIGMISDRIKRDAYLRKLAGMISIDERSLNDELQRLLRRQRSSGVRAEFKERSGQRVGSGSERAQQAENVAGDEDELVARKGEQGGQAKEQARGEERERTRTFGLDRYSRNRLQWEDYLIGLLLKNPGLSKHICGIITDGDFAGTDTRELYRIINTVYQRGSSPLHQPFEEYVPSVLLGTLARAKKNIEAGSPLDGEGLVRDAEQCAFRLKRASLRKKITELGNILREAESARDAATTRQYQEQLQECYRQLRTIDSATHLQG